MRTTVQLDPLTQYLLNKLKQENHENKITPYEIALIEMGCYLYRRPIGCSLDKMTEVSPLPPGIMVEEFEHTCTVSIPMIDLDADTIDLNEKWCGPMEEVEDHSLVSVFYEPPQFSISQVPHNHRYERWY